MPIQLTYPGVYVQELPSGTHTITGVSTTITAFIGYVRRGPVGTPVQCLNFGDFQRVFGGLDADSPTSFQVSQFFLNGGSEAWVTRLVAASPAPILPKVTLLGGAAGDPVLPLQASNPGSWGENVFVTVDYLSAAADSFNLTATLCSPDGKAIESQVLGGVTLDPAKPNYIVDVLQESPNPYANLLGVAGLQSTASTPLPFASGTILTFGQTAGAARLTLNVTTESGVAPLNWQAPGTYSGTTRDDLVAALRSVLASAAAGLALPALAGAVVRNCFAPSDPAAQAVQIVLPDPGCADYVIGVSAEPPSLFATVKANRQSHRLTAPPAAEPDGASPGGFDIAGNEVARTGIYALDGMRLVNLITVPDLAGMDAPSYLTAATALLNYALQHKAFAILDIPASVDTPAEAVRWITTVPASFGQGIISAAAYFPQVEVPTPFSSQPMILGASGTMAGIYAATDTARGVWKAPAGITAALAGVQQLQYVMNDHENGKINPLGLNALRTFPIYGNIAWGARTLASANVADDDWKYVSVRRLALYIEQSLTQGLEWTVFEPNDEALWAQIRLSSNSFLHALFQQGAFAGSSPAQAYQCICDASTTTPEDLENGVVNVLVLFAPVKPAEFVTISLQLMAGQSSN